MDQVYTNGAGVTHTHPRAFKSLEGVTLDVFCDNIGVLNNLVYDDSKE